MGTKIDLVSSPDVLRQHKAAIEAFIQAQPFSALPELQLVSNTNLSGLKDLMRVIKQAAAALMSRQVRSDTQTYTDTLNPGTSAYPPFL